MQKIEKHALFRVVFPRLRYSCRRLSLSRCLTVLKFQASLFKWQQGRSAKILPSVLVWRRRNFSVGKQLSWLKGFFVVELELDDFIFRIDGMWVVYLGMHFSVDLVAKLSVTSCWCVSEISAAHGVEVCNWQWVADQQGLLDKAVF